MTADLSIAPSTVLPPSGSAGQAAMMSLNGKKAPPTPAQIDKLAQDFEGEFMSQMISPMFDSPETQFFGGGESEDVYKSIMVQQFGTLIAKSGGIGIADMVKKELLHLQEVQSAPAQATQTVKG